MPTKFIDKFNSKGFSPFVNKQEPVPIKTLYKRNYEIPKDIRQGFNFFDKFHLAKKDKDNGDVSTFLQESQSKSNKTAKAFSDKIDQPFNRSTVFTIPLLEPISFTIIDNEGAMIFDPKQHDSLKTYSEREKKQRLSKNSSSNQPDLKQANKAKIPRQLFWSGMAVLTLFGLIAAVVFLSFIIFTN